jgi:hypothetical protein
MASKDAKMSKKATAGKTKHVTLMSPQKHEIIRRLENSESCNVIIVAYNIGSSTNYTIHKQNDQLWSFMVSRESVEGLLK